MEIILRCARAHGHQLHLIKKIEFFIRIVVSDKKLFKSARAAQGAALIRKSDICLRNSHFRSLVFFAAPVKGEELARKPRQFLAFGHAETHIQIFCRMENMHCE